MKKDGIVKTSAPQLPCKNILHIVAQDEAVKWKQLVIKCLQTAEKAGVSSIAFPALGAGSNLSLNWIVRLTS